ncbi:unnamed protein product [Phaeothamnion confervicola]
MAPTIIRPVVLHGRCTDTDERVQMFEEQGKVVDAYVMTERDSGRSRGFGFVTFASEDDARRAIENMDGRDVDGRTIRVTHSQPAPDKQARDYEQGEVPKVYVGALSEVVTTEDLMDLFAQHGQVTDAIVMTDRNTGASRGFGFVTFSSQEEAMAAISALDGSELRGGKIRVNVPMAPREKPMRDGRQARGSSSYDRAGGGGGDFEESGEPKLYVGNLSFETSTEDLYSRFGQYGTITDAIVMTDRETGHSRGFGFVTFGDRGQAESAIQQLDGSDVDGRYIKVNFSRKRKPRGDDYAW